MKLEKPKAAKIIYVDNPPLVGRPSLSWRNLFTKTPEVDNTKELIRTWFCLRELTRHGCKQQSPLVLEVGDILDESAKNFLKTALSTGKENIENKKDEKVIGKTIEDAISDG
ncbi:7430_t:CDS:2, partial [Paraglomus brasilianum]